MFIIVTIVTLVKAADFGDDMREYVVTQRDSED